VLHKNGLTDSQLQAWVKVLPEMQNVQATDAKSLATVFAKAGDSVMQRSNQCD